MAKIVLSMAGEGRGHATRVRALVEHLRHRHAITLLAPGDAHRLLAPRYAGSEVRVREIPCLRFHYHADGRLDRAATLARGARFVAGLRRRVAEVEAALREERPDLGITDFEPLLPRAARRLGVPFLSIDHQHVLVVGDLGELPARLRLHAAYMGAIVGAWCRGQRRTLVSSFYCPPLRRGWRASAEQVGVFLGPEVRAARPQEGDHLVAYIRRHAPDSLLAALRATGRSVAIYGLGERPREGTLRFRPVDPRAFVEELAGASALVTTAGNQVVGEALHLRKPVFAMPEAGNHEQEINAYYLARSGAGATCPIGRVTPRALGEFLDELPRHRAAIDPAGVDGLPRALEVIAAELGEAPGAPASGAAGAPGAATAGGDTP